MSSRRSGLNRICKGHEASGAGQGEGGTRRYLVTSDGVEEGRDPFVEEVEEVGEIDDERAAEVLNVVLLEDRQDLQMSGGN